MFMLWTMMLTMIVGIALAGAQLRRRDPVSVA